MLEDLFGTTIPILEKAIDLRAQRHSVISSNVANAETPNFKSVNFNFEEELKKIMPPENSLRLKTTDSNHMPVKINPEKVKGYVTNEYTANPRADGNTVDLDNEVVKMSKNQIMHDAMAQLIQKRFEGLINAIREGK